MEDDEGGSSPGTFDSKCLLGADEGLATSILLGLGGGAPGFLEFKSFSDCRYVNAKTVGISVRLRPPDGHVDVIFLYRGGAAGYETFSGPLPEALQWSDLNRDVVRRLGEPSDRFGGGRVPVGISYELLGLDVTFQNRSWDDDANPIAFLGVFERKEVSFGMCTRCGKQARFKCGRCKARQYCSSSCQTLDWKTHKNTCADLSLAKNEALPTCQETVASSKVPNMLSDMD